MSVRSATAWVALFAILVVAGLLLGADLDGEPGSPPAGPPKAPPLTARVERVVDGDTIAVRVASRRETVRYIGVDTPESVMPGEPVACFGKAAAAFNKRLVAGREVRLAFDRQRRDRYGRLLAYVDVSGRSVNEALLRGGYARTLEIKPNAAHAARYRRLEDRAQAAGRGLWKTCSGR
jgi:micrococcal nuclease